MDTVKLLLYYKTIIKWIWIFLSKSTRKCNSVSLVTVHTFRFCADIWTSHQFAYYLIQDGAECDRKKQVNRRSSRGTLTICAYLWSDSDNWCSGRGDGGGRHGASPWPLLLQEHRMQQDLFCVSLQNRQIRAIPPSQWTQHPSSLSNTETGIKESYSFQLKWDITPKSDISPAVRNRTASLSPLAPATLCSYHGK